MEEGSTSSKNSWNQQYLLAKLLLHKYGVMHEIFEQQLINYCVACCKQSIGGTFEIDFDKKIILFHLRTEIFYKRKKQRYILRHKYSPYKILYTKNGTHRSLYEEALTNLSTWCSELMWSNIKIDLVLDGERYV